MGAEKKGNGEVKPLIFMATYCDILANYIRRGVNNGDQPLQGMHIIVDAGNGAGGFFANKVLKSLGADTTGSQFLEPDGNFPKPYP